MNRLTLPIDPSRIETFATREEWLTARGGGRIGASVAHRILTAPWEAYEELTGERPAPSAALQAVFDRGHRWERMVREEYGATRGRTVLTAGEAAGVGDDYAVILRHATEEWAVQSPDGFVLDGDLGQIEAKTNAGGQGWATEDVVVPSANAYDEELCPAAYANQGYHQLAVSGLPFVDLVCLLPRYEVRVVRLMADPVHQDWLINTIGEWRLKHILGGVAPEVDGSKACSRGLARRHTPDGRKELRVPTAEERARVLYLGEIKAEIKHLEEKEAELANQVLDSIGTSYGLDLGGKAKALRINLAGRETIDAAGLRAAHPEIAAQFTRVGSSSAHVRLYNL